MSAQRESALGLDFGTTNTVVALSNGGGASELIEFAGEASEGAVFRSALCFWEEGVWSGIGSGIACEAGPWAIAEYLRSPPDSRFIQSFKTVAASPLFERAVIYGKAFRFEDLGRLFLQRLIQHAGGRLDKRPPRVIVGRPVEFAGARADPELAQERYRLMLEDFGVELRYVYEPLAAAYSYASRLDEAATVLVADFGGGTTDFSIVRVTEPGAEPRCVPLASAGVGIAGDRFDRRIIERLVLPLLGKGGTYRSFGKSLDIPNDYFVEFADWSRLALMRNRRTMDELRQLQRAATDPGPISRMIALIEHEQGFPLYHAVGQTKRTLSTHEVAEFRFSGGGVEINAEVRRSDFEAWIAQDLRRIEAALETVLARAEITPDQIDRVFLTGGSSLLPSIRALFQRLFRAEQISTGDELTSIAHGLAQMGTEPNAAMWLE